MLRMNNRTQGKKNLQFFSKAQKVLEGSEISETDYSMGSNYSSKVIKYFKTCQNPTLKSIESIIFLYYSFLICKLFFLNFL